MFGPFKLLRGGCGSNIDIAFGLTSVLGQCCSSAPSNVMFADGGQDEESEQGEEIQIEEREIPSGASWR